MPPIKCFILLEMDADPMIISQTKMASFGFISEHSEMYHMGTTEEKHNAKKKT